MKAIFIICFSAVLVLGGCAGRDVYFSEVCLTPLKPEYPRWIELTAVDDVDLKGWKLCDGGGMFYEFKETTPLRKGGILLLCFHPKNKVSEDFSRRYCLDRSKAKIIDILDSTPYNAARDYVSDAFSKGGEKGLARYLSENATPYTRCLPKSLWKEALGKAAVFLKKHGLPEKYKRDIAFVYGYYPPDRDEIALFDDKNVLREYIFWGRNEADASWRYRDEALKNECARKSPAQTEYPFAFYSTTTSKSIMWRKKDGIGFCYVLEPEFGASPGFKWSVRPIEKVALDIDTLKWMENGRATIELRFRNVHDLSSTVFEIQFASDKDFTKPLKESKQKPSVGNSSCEVELSEKETSTFLLQPELYYRVRYIRPDGSASGWRRGEFGKRFLATYERGLHVAKVRGLDTAIHGCVALEKERGELVEETEKLKAALEKEKNQKAREVLAGKIVANEKKILDLNEKIDKMTDDIAKMKKATR